MNCKIKYKICLDPLLSRKAFRKLKLPVPELSQWQSAVSLKSVSRDGHAPQSAVAAELQSVVENRLISHREFRLSCFQILFGEGAI